MRSSIAPRPWASTCRSTTFALAITLLVSIATACLSEDTSLPEEYRTLEVPTERLRSKPAIERGRILFDRYCALCHGARGDGAGPRSANLSTPPRDLSRSDWRHSTSPRKTYFAIREGIRGTAMPSWKSLSEEECWDLVAYTLSLSEE